ncbi:MAG TPA: DUF6089 family protein [Parafilimonas sp.]|nr:DUF6089 family protein [Parafilimonas sp.]
MVLRNLVFRIFILLTCLHTTLHAQDLSLQFNGGLMNYGGDLQSQVYTFKESELTAGANIRYTIKNYSLRLGFNYGSVQGDDKKGTQYASRNLNFNSNIVEGNLCLEYDLFAMDDDKKFIPYAFLGGGVFHFNPYTNYNGQKVYLQPLGTEGEGLSIYPNRKIYALTQIEVPYGVGVRYKLSSNFLIGLEFNSRHLFTDYLDDVSRTYPDESELFKAHGQLAVDLSYRGNEVNPSSHFPAAGKMRGNPHQKDNFYTSVLTLTYIFPDHSLFNGFSSRDKRSLNCPKKVH